MGGFHRAGLMVQGLVSFGVMLRVIEGEVR